MQQQKARKPHRDSGVNPVGGYHRAVQFYRIYYQSRGLLWATYIRHGIEDGRISEAQAADWRHRNPGFASKQARGEFLQARRQNPYLN